MNNEKGKKVELDDLAPPVRTLIMKEAAGTAIQSVQLVNDEQAAVTSSAQTRARNSIPGTVADSKETKDIERPIIQIESQGKEVELQMSPNGRIKGQVQADDDEGDDDGDDDDDDDDGDDDDDDDDDGREHSGAATEIA